MRLPLRISVAAALLTLALVGMVIREGMARDAGQEVVLAINAYDPRSPLSGHYAAFQIQDELPAGAPCPSGATSAGGFPFSRKADGWIALKRDGARHRVAGVAAGRQQARALGELAVRGSASCGRRFFQRDRPESRVVTLHIGVDRFHADQQEAEAIERDLRGATAAPAFVVVSVGKDGKARLKGIIVGGKRTDLTWL
ncbi:MAG: GDYXXLXY domain-containing protein [Phenylobacterium sp.]